MGYSYFKGRLLPRVRQANKLPPKQKRSRLDFWLFRSTMCFQNNNYDLGMEYLAMVHLALFMDLNKNSSIRLSLWRIFVREFRLAFSDYGFQALSN